MHNMGSLIFNQMFDITSMCFYVWMKSLWYWCLCLRVLKEKAWAPSLSRYPAATWSSEQLQNQTVTEVTYRTSAVCYCSISLYKPCHVFRPLLDGRSWTGSEMLEFAEANDGPRGQRGDDADRRALAHQLLQSAEGTQHAGLPVRPTH